MEGIKCSSCGKLYGNVVQLYYTLKDYIQKDFVESKKITTDIEQLYNDPAFNIKMGPLLTALHIENECCRLALITMKPVSAIN
jgi:DNA-directed RNA polymerase subunit N (RpoN/RPB10)